MRKDGREATELRPISFKSGFVSQHPANVLVSFGKTRVLVCASVEEKVPLHRQQVNSGWLTAEYGMLPASTTDRKQRPGFKTDGRSVEIQRLIGRSLRRAVNLDKIGSRSIYIDCDVIEADGGTRTAAITGGWVALALCLKRLFAQSKIPAKSLSEVLIEQIAAVAVGIGKDQILTDLSYEEDARVDTDFNLVACPGARIIELQATAERSPMGREQIDQVINQGLLAIDQLFLAQLAALKEAGISLQ